VKPADDPPAVTSPAPRAAWQALYRSDQEAVVSQSLPWRDLVLADGGYRDVSLLYEFASGRQVLLPLARPVLRPAWASTTASWPGDWGIGGPISPCGKVRPAEAAAVLADVAGRGALVTEIQLRPGADESWLGQAPGLRVAEHRWRCHMLDLTGGFGVVWRDRFRGTARTAVRKAERSGIEVEAGRTGGLLREFFLLYQTSIDRWAAMQHEPAWLTRWRTTRFTSPARLAAAAEHFGADCTVWLARREGEPLAGIIVLCSGGYAKYWRGAMDKDRAGPLRANELLHRLAIEDACARGHDRYDMGFTRPGSPLAAFKEKLGAAAMVAHTLRAERIGIPAAGDAARELVKKMIGFRDV
jgi:hypothetical protein